jgi:hypothetical protein
MKIAFFCFIIEFSPARSDLLDMPIRSLFFLNIFFQGSMPLFLFFRLTNNEYQVYYIYTTALQCFPNKSCTMAGLEPGPSVPEADAMSTAPRRQGMSGQSISFY